MVRRRCWSAGGKWGAWAMAAVLLVPAPVWGASAPSMAATLTVPPLPPCPPSPAPTDRPLALSEAIALAMYHQPQLAIAGAAIRAAAGRTQQAESGLLPSVSLSADYTRLGPASRINVGSVGGTFTAGGYTANFAGQQLLYNFGHTQAQVAQSRDQQSSASQAFAQTRQDVINQVKQGYYTLLQNQRLVEVQQSNVASQQAHLDLARARFDAGVAPRADVVRAEAAVSQAQFNLVTVQNTAAVSRVTLNAAMGIDVRTPTRVQETKEQLPTLPEPAALVEQALACRPEIRQLCADVSAAQEAVKAARTANRPGFFADANYGLRGATFPPDNASWSYGVSLQWPLLDSGLTRGRVEEAEANLASAQAKLCQGELTVESEVTQAYLSMQAAGQQVITAVAGVASAEESLKVSTGRYQAGVAPYLEVLDAQTAQVTAQVSQVNADYGLSLARAALERALGRGGA